MAAPRTFNDEQRAAIIELVNHQGQSVAKAVRTLAAGHADLEPFKITRDTVDRIAREARALPTQPIQDLELTEALDTLGRQALGIIGHRLATVREQPNKFDAREILTITQALTEAKSLVKARPGNNGHNQPAFLDTLNQTTPSNQGQTQPERRAARSLSA